MAFEYKIPKLVPDRALTRPILFSMRDLAFYEQMIRYDDLSDGVVYGCQLFEENMQIGVKNGLIKYAGRLYIMEQPQGFPYEPTDTWTVLKVAFGPQKISQDFEYYSGELIMTDTTDSHANEMELGRFKLKKGSRLRTQYVNFEDMNTEYDTANLIHVHQAGKEEYTISPMITDYFAREAYPLLRDNALDISFCSVCLAAERYVRRDIIQHYIANRMGIDYKAMDNVEIHRCLTTILAAIKNDTSVQKARRPTNKRIIIE